MNRTATFDDLFRQAVTAMDEGDVHALTQLLDAHPQLATERLTSPGEWLTSVIAGPLQGFFKEPYLLWFVSEDAVRNKTLPKNIAQIAGIIVQKARSVNAQSLQEQLDYAVKLVAWSWVAKECGVQLELLDVMIDAGAAIEGVSNDALVNGHFEAAEHLIKRGAGLTLATALCLGLWNEADMLAKHASPEQKQFSFVMAALNGKAEALKRAISYGVNINAPSQHLYSHATALHHAVWSGSLDAVKLLIKAGADTTIRDSIYDGTPLGWAEYSGKQEIADYLREWSLSHKVIKS